VPLAVFKFLEKLALCLVVKISILSVFNILKPDGGVDNL